MTCPICHRPQATATDEALWDTNKVGAFMYDVLPAELKGDSWGRYFSSGNA